MKKYYFTLTFLLFFSFPVLAEKTIIENDGNDFIHSYPAVDSLSENNIIAWVNVDDKINIKSIVVKNIETEEELYNIQFDQKLIFDSNEYSPGHKLKISNNWLAITYSFNNHQYLSVFDFTNKEKGLVYQMDGLCASNFDMYGDSLVVINGNGSFCAEEDKKVVLVDLSNNSEEKVIKKGGYYGRVNLYKNKIALLEFGDKVKLLVYDILENEWIEELKDIDLGQAPHPVFDGRRYIYPSKCEEKNHRGRLSKYSLKLYDFETGKTESIYNFNNEIVGIDLRYNKLLFSRGDLNRSRFDGFSYWDIFLYDFEDKSLKSLGEKKYYQIQPKITKNYFVWIDGETGVNRVNHGPFKLLSNIIEEIDEKYEHDINNIDLYNRLRGRIIIKVEDVGQAFYVHPTKNKMYYLGRPKDAFSTMRGSGVGITENDFELYKNCAPERLSGNIMMRVKSNGEAYYVNPSDLKMYYLGRPSDAFNVMRNLGLGISNNDFIDLSE